jgi:hypothetical protein
MHNNHQNPTHHVPNQMLSKEGQLVSHVLQLAALLKKK